MQGEDAIEHIKSISTRWLQRARQRWLGRCQIGCPVAGPCNPPTEDTLAPGSLHCQIPALQQGFQFDSGPSFMPDCPSNLPLILSSRYLYCRFSKCQGPLNFGFPNPRESSHSFNLRYLCRDMMIQGLLSMPDWPSNLLSNLSSKYVCCRL